MSSASISARTSRVLTSSFANAIILYISACARTAIALTVFSKGCFSPVTLVFSGDLPSITAAAILSVTVLSSGVSSLFNISKYCKFSLSSGISLSIIYLLRLNVSSLTSRPASFIIFSTCGSISFHSSSVRRLQVLSFAPEWIA